MAEDTDRLDTEKETGRGMRKKREIYFLMMMRRRRKRRRMIAFKLSKKRERLYPNHQNLIIKSN